MLNWWFGALWFGYLNNEKMALVVLGYIGDEIRPSYMGLFHNLTIKRVPIKQTVY